MVEFGGTGMAAHDVGVDHRASGLHVCDECSCRVPPAPPGAEMVMSLMEPVSPTKPIETASASKPAKVGTKVWAKHVNVSYGDKQALFDVSLEIPEKSVTALIGPSGCGKSTFLRSINRMNDTIEGCRV